MKLIHDIRRISSLAIPVVARLLKVCVRIPPGDGYSLVVCVECFEIEIEISATNRSLVQRSPTASGASLQVIYRLQELEGRNALSVAAP